MDELLAKISSYNIFNFLVPGALFCVALKALGIADLAGDEIAAALVVYYVTGMALSRAGSLLIGRTTRRFRIKPKNSYAEFVRAAEADAKIDILLETANTFRTIAATFVLLAGAKLASVFGVWRVVDRDVALTTGLALLAALFIVSYVNQVRYVDRRVRVSGERSNATVEESA